MNFDLFDLAGFLGVLLIVIAYLLLQLGKTSHLVVKLFAAKRCRLIADHSFSYLQVQRVGVLDRSVLVLDQPDRTIEVARCQEAAG
jgi:hypothetical protein